LRRGASISRYTGHPVHVPPHARGRSKARGWPAANLGTARPGTTGQARLDGSHRPVCLASRKHRSHRGHAVPAPTGLAGSGLTAAHVFSRAGMAGRSSRHTVPSRGGLLAELFATTRPQRSPETTTAGAVGGGVVNSRCRAGKLGRARFFTRREEFADRASGRLSGSRAVVHGNAGARRGGFRH